MTLTIKGIDCKTKSLPSKVPETTTPALPVLSLLLDNRHFFAKKHSLWGSLLTNESSKSLSEKYPSKPNRASFLRHLLRFMATVPVSSAATTIFVSGNGIPKNNFVEGLLSVWRSDLCVSLIGSHHLSSSSDMCLSLSPTCIFLPSCSYSILLPTENLLVILVLVPIR